MFRQGDILKIENISFPVVIVSKDFFNESGLAIGCAILEKASESPLHIAINTKKIQGFIYVEELKTFDLHKRGYRKIAAIETMELINVVDAVQGIFDYI